MQKFARIAALFGVIAVSMIAAGTVGNVAAASSPAVGHVYVNGNTAPFNTIAGFDRHADGTLTPLAGSPFAIGGRGTGTNLGSQGALQLSADGRYLLAVDAGSNEISVARIYNDGSLKAVGDPVSANGITPVSIAVHGDLVYVANTGAGGSNYTGFTLNAGGHLAALSNSTYPLPDNALPGDVLFNTDGTNLAGTRGGPNPGGPSFIDSFAVGADGRLAAAAGSPFPAQGIGPIGAQFRPTNSTQLFVSNAHDGPLLGSVSAFNVAADGALSSIGASPFADLQTAPCWVEISHDGQYLFTVNTATPSISRYSIAANGELTLLGSTPFNNPTGLRPFDLRLDPSGTHLYVVGADRIAAFSVSGGSLAELTTSPFSLPAGLTAAFGIVAN